MGIVVLPRVNASSGYVGILCKVADRIEALDRDIVLGIDGFPKIGRWSRKSGHYVCRMAFEQVSLRLIGSQRREVHAVIKIIMSDLRPAGQIRPLVAITAMQQVGRPNQCLPFFGVEPNGLDIMNHD